MAETGTALDRIAAQVSDLSGAVSAIAASAQEQARALQEVNGAVNRMDQMTQQNAAMVEETSAAAQSLAGETEDLARAVGHFETGQSGAAGRPGRAVRSPPLGAARRVAPVGRGPDPAAPIGHEAAQSEDHRHQRLTRPRVTRPAAAPGLASSCRPPAERPSGRRRRRDCPTRWFGNSSSESAPSRSTMLSRWTKLVVFMRSSGRPIRATDRATTWVSACTKAICRSCASAAVSITTSPRRRARKRRTAPPRRPRTEQTATRCPAMPARPLCGPNSGCVPTMSTSGGNSSAKIASGFT